MDNRLKSIRSVIVKLTNRCNIRCEYCYENIVANGSDMTSEKFQQMVKSILSSTDEDRVLFILHGGEPTMLHDEWFEENFQQAYILADLYSKKIEFSIQSNLIKISETKLKIFEKYRVGIGGSLDNPDSLVESLRPLARNALNTYFKAKNLGINIGILSTINSSNIHSMRDFCGWLFNSLHVKHFKANLAYSVGTGLELFVPQAQSFFKAQQDIIEFMIEADGEFIEENLSHEIIRFFENYSAGKERTISLCDDKKCGAGSKVVGITPNGDILPCGRFAWSDNDHQLGILNDEIENSEDVFFERLNRFHALNSENWHFCDSCDAKSICSFGCQAFIVRSKTKFNIECEPTLMRFQYYKENYERLQGLYEKICLVLKRPAMSSLEQKISRLMYLTPLEKRSAIHDRLTKLLPEPAGM